MVSPSDFRAILMRSFAVSIQITSFPTYYIMRRMMCQEK